MLPSVTSNDSRYLTADNTPLGRTPSPIRGQSTRIVVQDGGRGQCLTTPSLSPENVFRKLSDETLSTPTNHKKINASPTIENLELFREKKVDEDLRLVSQKVVDLQVFINHLPKGGDTHCHLTGTVEIKEYLEFAVKDDLYFEEETFTFFRKKDENQYKSCQSASVIYDNIHLQTRLKEKATLRGREHPENKSLANEFFKTFSVFESIERYMGLTDLLTPLLIAYSSQKDTLYVEVSKGCEFNLPNTKSENELEADIKLYLRNFPESDFFADKVEFKETLLTKLKIMNQMLSKKVKKYIDYINAAEQTPECLLKLGFQSSLFSLDNPVVVRLNVDINRELPLPEFFLDLALGFMIADQELRSKNPRVLGIVISGIEHNFRSLKNKKAQHKMISFFAQIYPEVGISLHAGELTESLVAEIDMKNAISSAIKEASPKRIGHAVCLKHEEDVDKVVRKLLKNNICIETCLSSNENTLSITNGHHPFKEYLSRNVAVTLNTDDAGVNGTSIRAEFLKAFERYNLSYFDFKNLARNQIRYCFLKGDEIYKPGSYTLKPEFEIKDDYTSLNPELQMYFKNNPKAYLQFRLEKAFKKFEVQRISK